LIAEPSRLSYSQLSTYAECGEKWRLEKGYKLGEGTWFATIAGSAIHEITELIDLQAIGKFDGEIPTFKEVFDRLLAEEDEKGVEVKPSGRVLKSIGKTGGPNKKDYDWWLHYGPECVENWITWTAENDYRLAVMPDGKPGIEIGFSIEVGGEKVVGFIDRIYLTPENRILILDLKSGQVPKSKIQLGVYKLGLMRQYGLEAELGTYWMAGDGELTSITDLTMYSASFIDSLFEQAWRGIRAGIFLPNVSAMCNGCGVKRYCRAVGGELALSVPIRETVTKPTPKEKAPALTSL
jgi:hypothetical protein